MSFLSVKPPSNDIAGVAAGKYDAPIAALAATIPVGSYFTMYHEPEDNMTGAQFTAMFKQSYKAAKGANPKITIGYVAMAYQWRPGSLDRRRGRVVPGRHRDRLSRGRLVRRRLPGRAFARHGVTELGSSGTSY